MSFGPVYPSGGKSVGAFLGSPYYPYRVTSQPGEQKGYADHPTYCMFIRGIHLAPLRPVPTFSEQNQLFAVLIGFWGHRNTRKRYIQRSFLEQVEAQNL